VNKLAQFTADQAGPQRLGGEGGLRHRDHGWSRSVLVNALTSRIFSLSHRRVAIVSAV
jgi:hypothetical protein